VTRTAARKTHLGSLTIKEATGDMGCMQASFGLSIKTGYRWYRLQHPSLIWTPSQIRLQVTWPAARKPHQDSLTFKTQHLNFAFVRLHKIGKFHFSVKTK